MVEGHRYVNETEMHLRNLRLTQDELNDHLLVLQSNITNSNEQNILGLHMYVNETKVHLRNLKLALEEQSSQLLTHQSIITVNEQNILRLHMYANETELRLSNLTLAQEEQGGQLFTLQSNMTKANEQNIMRFHMYANETDLHLRNLSLAQEEQGGQLVTLQMNMATTNEQNNMRLHMYANETDLRLRNLQSMLNEQSDELLTLQLNVSNSNEQLHNELRSVNEALVMKTFYLQQNISQVEAHLGNLSWTQVEHTSKLQEIRMNVSALNDHIQQELASIEDDLIAETSTIKSQLDNHTDYADTYLRSLTSALHEQASDILSISSNMSSSDNQIRNELSHTRDTILSEISDLWQNISLINSHMKVHLSNVSLALEGQGNRIHTLQSTVSWLSDQLHSGFMNMTTAHSDLKLNVSLLYGRFVNIEVHLSNVSLTQESQIMTTAAFQYNISILKRNFNEALSGKATELKREIAQMNSHTDHRLQVIESKINKAVRASSTLSLVVVLSVTAAVIVFCT